MARGNSLQAIIAMVRAEAGQSASVAAGVDNLPALIQKIQRVYELYYVDYDWPFLRNDFPLDLAAGQRFYDMPSITLQDDSTATLSSQRIEAVAINYSGKPVPIERGISFEQYAQYNSEDPDNPEMASPARRWDIKRTSADVEQVEIWPIPTDSTQQLIFRGIKGRRRFVAMDDPCDLDDQMIALTVAAEILTRQGAKDAPMLERAAAARYKQLKGRSKSASRTITMSGKSAARSNSGTIIRIGSQSN